ncbi:MAG: 3-oxoacyl-[acyl-carrier-protein] reductase [Phycisphaeraceae bacterium]|nr:3-oxoacyl-[acyl-carrier-protein] reductase [Phycisphaeraceae bacterium]MCB9847325.1 3-oxoacyl-[acyl-carrier-protein] reductase [Phycisphaeraceae bacterium]
MADTPANNAPRRVAVVTGASRGIGKAIALQLAGSGCHVALISRSAGPLSEVRSLIEEAGGSASVHAVDAADSGRLAETIESIASDQGRLDILVNNAGITRDNLALRMSDEDFDTVINVNLKACFVACRAAIRPMMKNKWGRIINIGSTSGVVGNPGQANYAAAKAGLVGMSKSLAREIGGKGITVNVIAPGFIETDMTAGLPENIKTQLTANLAVKRLGAVEDIAHAVAYVASEGAGYLTGQCLCVDGGLTMC